MTNFNAGLDVSLWRGKLGVEFDYFYRLRDDILATRLSTLPNTFGATLPQENLEAIDNRGFELVVKTLESDQRFQIQPFRKYFMDTC